MPEIRESVTVISLWEEKTIRMKRRHDLRVVRPIPRSTAKSAREMLRFWFDCAESRHVVEITGVSQTDEKGEMTWNLTDFVCMNELYWPISEFADPISFLATPISSTPVYITTTKIPVTESEPYPVLKIYSWDSNGSPANGTMFSWYCRLQYYERVM